MSSRLQQPSRLQQYQDYLCANLAEDAGHMGWTREDYPGSPKRRAQQKLKRMKEYESISDLFDEASETIG